MHPDYYHPSNDVYMSNSQWKHWLECPARARAMFVDHTYKEPANINFAVGSLVDALLLEPNKEQEVLQQYADLLTGKKGQALAVCNDAYAMADRVRSCDQIMRIIDASDCQVSYTFEVGGMQWKCRLDCLSDSLQLIADLKTTGDINGEAYVPRLNRRGNFIAQWDYRRQLALYREAVRQNKGEDYSVAIIAVEKKAPFDCKVFHWDAERYHQLDMAIAEIEENAWIARDMIAGKEPVWRCENCTYCATTRQDFIFVYSDPE